MTHATHKQTQKIIQKESHTLNQTHGMKFKELHARNYIHAHGLTHTNKNTNTNANANTHKNPHKYLQKKLKIKRNYRITKFYL